MKPMYKRSIAILLLAAFLLLGGCAAAKEEATPTEEINMEPVDLDMDTDALFFGRTYDKAGIRWMNWSGSGFSVRFQGGGLAAEFYSNAPEAKILYTYGLVRVGLSEDIQAVVTELQKEGDSNIHYLQLEQCQKWELNLNHTVRSAYESRGEAIMEKIKEITGW